MLLLGRLTFGTSNVNYLVKDPIIQKFKGIHYYDKYNKCDSINKPAKWYYTWLLRFLTTTPQTQSFRNPAIKPLNRVYHEGKLKHSVGSSFAQSYPKLNTSKLHQSLKTHEPNVSSVYTMVNNGRIKNGRNEPYYYNKEAKRTVKSFKEQFAQISDKSSVYFPKTQENKRSARINQVKRINFMIEKAH